MADDPTSKGVYFKFNKVADGWWRAEFRLNATESGLSGIRCAGEGETAEDATAAATRFASAALNDPLVQAALPGAALAVHAARTLAKAMKSGELKHVADSFVSPIASLLSSSFMDAAHGLLSGYGPVCLVCADGSTPTPKAKRDRGTPAMTDDKRFPWGPPGMPVPPDGADPAAAPEQAAAILGRAKLLAAQERQQKALQQRNGNGRRR